jgi:hypothetical protein
MTGELIMSGSEMSPERQRVAELIQSAFQGVLLGNGIGLQQGQGRDEYANRKKLAELRASDEKDDWSAIPAAELDACYSSLSFFDAEGMRFHLPAFLIADLREQLETSDVVFSLTFSPEFKDHQQKQFALLNPSQRNAVREFLLLRREAERVDFVWLAIDEALRDYWVE